MASIWFGPSNYNVIIRSVVSQKRVLEYPLKQYFDFWRTCDDLVNARTHVHNAFSSRSFLWAHVGNCSFSTGTQIFMGVLSTSSSQERSEYTFTRSSQELNFGTGTGQT
jgi:hypothetical protein